MRLVLACGALAMLACAPAAPEGQGSAPAGAAPVAEDTLRGIVQVVGSEPATTVELEPAGGGTPVVLEGDRRVLDRLAGLEVAVRGERVAGGRLRVTRTEVRAANGIPAVDGVLARDAGRDVLLLRDGSRRAIARLPEALRGRTGARVWLAGPLDGDIDSFGIIVDRR
jgi:hypothetical protein